MIFELTTSILAGGLAGFSYLQQQGWGGNDHQKIVNIAKNCGLVNKEGKEIRIHRRTKLKNGMEYVYQLPQGLSEKQFQEKKHNFEDGLNIKKTLIEFDWRDLKQIDWKGGIKKQFKELISKKRIKKALDISFDGMLKFKVYDHDLPEEFFFSEELLKKISGWNVLIGTIRDQLIKHDFDEIYNMVIAGSPGYGKTVLLKNIITTLILKQPDNVTFTLVDLKGGLAFNRFSKLKQTEVLATNPEEALEALESVNERMERTIEYLRQKDFEDVKEAGIKDRHFVIIDEAADLSEEKDALEYIKKICAKGRGAGYRVLYCTQYPINESIPTTVRQNCDARISFKLQTAIASNAALDEPGAEDLPFIRGRAIYKSPHGKTIVQTPLIKNSFIKEAIQPHINIRPRQERVETSEKGNRKGAKGGTDTLIIEETRLS